MRFVYLLIILYLLPGIAIAQDGSEADSKKLSFFFSFDNSRTFVRGQNTVVNGFKTGVDVGDQYKLGLGFYSLSADIVDRIDIQREGKPDTSRLAQLEMGWLAATFEYVFYTKDKWQFSIPVNLGAGSSYYEYFEDGKSVRAKSGPILVNEIGASGQYKFLRWAGVGFGLGYRSQLISNTEINEKFNSPFYVLKIKLFVGEIYRIAFPKKEKG